MYNPRNYSYHANSVVNQRRLRQRRYLRQRLNLYRTCHGIRTQTNDAIFLSMIIRLPPQSSNDHYVNEFFNGSSFPWIRRTIENVKIWHIKHIIKCISIKYIYIFLYNYSYYYRYKLVIIDIDSVYLLQIVLTRETIYKIETFRPHKSETIVQYLTIRNLRNLNLEILL